MAENLFYAVMYSIKNEQYDVIFTVMMSYISEKIAVTTVLR